MVRQAMEPLSKISVILLLSHWSDFGFIGYQPSEATAEVVCVYAIPVLFLSTVLRDCNETRSSCLVLLVVVVHACVIA